MDCRVPVKVVSGNFKPLKDTYGWDSWQRLVDGQTSTVMAYEPGWGARTDASSTSPYITLQLDASYNDVRHYISLFTPKNGGVGGGGTRLCVWV